MAVQSRQRILEFLKRCGEASVSELSRALRLTPVTIRHHLEALRAEGLVAKPEPRRKRGPGRPEMAYRLTSEAAGHMPRNFEELCTCLLQWMEVSEGATRLPAALREIGDDLAREALQEPVGSKRRMRAGQAFLERRGYFPALRREGDEVWLTLANCPYLEAARRTPALCAFDQSMLRALFGTEVRMVGRIVEEAPVCTFALQD